MVILYQICYVLLVKRWYSLIDRYVDKWGMNRCVENVFCLTKLEILVLAALTLH